MNLTPKDPKKRLQDALMKRTQKQRESTSIKSSAAARPESTAPQSKNKRYGASMKKY